MITRLVGDTFVVNDGETYIVYSPRKSKIARVSSDPLSDVNLCQALRQNGFFDDVPQSVCRLCGFRDFKSLTLLLTRRCNLACIYCYASARSEGTSMPIELAHGAVRWFMAQLKEDVARISFHGGGEPTLEEGIIRNVVELVERNYPERRRSFLITTNGTASREFMEWMMSKKFGISISADGPPEIQDRNRPFANGEPSSPVVESRIRLLAEAGYPFSIRMTYGAEDALGGTVAYFAKLGVKKIHLEPLFPYGREYEKITFQPSSGSVISAPHADHLVSQFLEAMEVARELGIRIHNGHLAHLLKWSGYFCGGASAQSMIVTQDGWLTGCLEVMDTTDAAQQPFRIGEWHPASRSFNLNAGSIDMLQHRHADEVPECKRCFARYVCACGCAVKAYRFSGSLFRKEVQYCTFTKNLLPRLIKEIASRSEV